MPYYKAIDNKQDTLDSRDIQARIEELALLEEENEADDDDRAELETLREFRDDVNSGEWRHGIIFIREDYFKDYAKDYAENIGAIDGNARWPNTHIDWEAAANELKYDFSSADFDGVTYYFNA